MKKFLLPLGLFAFLAQPVCAGDLSGLASLTQSEFRTVSEDLGAAFSYKPVSPTVALGITGFDIGLEVTSTDVSKSAAALTRAGASTSGSSMDTLIVPKLHLHKGLPLGFDIGAFIANLPAINAQLVGGELRYALVDGGTATPAVGIRGAVTSLNGSSQLSLGTRSVDISISKGFALVTPYAGLGQVWVNSTPNVAGLSNESFTQGKVFGGVNLNLGLINFALEADKTGNTSSWSLKMGWRW
jgi:hypothetical protein